MIIGAGPGGMQAALTASERGFKVILIEKEKELGGVLQLANKAPDKFRIDNLIHYFKGQIEKDPNIEVWLNYEVTEEKLDELAENLMPLYRRLAADRLFRIFREFLWL